MQYDLGTEIPQHCCQLIAARNIELHIPAAIGNRRRRALGDIRQNDGIAALDQFKCVLASKISSTTCN